MNTESEQKFLDDIRHALTEAEQDLDAYTLTQLRRARQRALKAYPACPWWRRRDVWMPTTAVTGLTVLALASVMWFTAPAPGLPPTEAEDLELLSAQDSLDFYADLDFYYWLTTSSNAG
ncbi:MAG: hypothetical protein ACE5H7_04575 [Acidiferrobacterales bacterium]